MKLNRLAFKHVSEVLRVDRQVLLLAAKPDWEALKYASAAPPGSRDIILESLKQHLVVLEGACERLRADCGFAAQAISLNQLARQLCSALPEFVVEALLRHWQ